MRKDFLDQLRNNTDDYFFKTQTIVNDNKDCSVIYAVFLRSNVLFAPEYFYNFIAQVQRELGIRCTIYTRYQPGELVKATQPLLFIKGSFKELCVLETRVLQTLGYPCSAAYNAYKMAKSFKKVSFISMGARHTSGPEAANMVDYGISLGSKLARAEGAKGFIGSSTAAGGYYFGLKQGLGTMPHALVGYAGSSLMAAKLYRKSFPNSPLVALVDYYGKEVDDALEVCNHFTEFAHSGRLMVRLDTNGKRYLQGLNRTNSLEQIRKYVKEDFIESLSDTELDYLIGRGVSAAAIFTLKEHLLKHGFSKVGIVASSGFNCCKTKLMGKIKAPISVIGTGSAFSGCFHEASVTADIICYNNMFHVKKGREFLIQAWEELREYKNQAPATLSK